VIEAVVPNSHYFIFFFFFFFATNISVLFLYHPSPASIDDEILALYVSAARSGHGGAAVNAGAMLMERGDHASAYAMYVEGSKVGEPSAFRTLAAMYRGGIHVRANERLAQHYDELADRIGGGDAQQ
jgi:hypothetical protein